MRTLFSTIKSLAKGHEIITATAAVLAVLVGITSVVVAHNQLTESVRSQERTIAEESFRDYLKLAIDEPKFAEGLSICSRSECKNPKDSYGWFVAYFLHAAEQIFRVYPQKEGWRNALEEHVCYHKEYLKGDAVSINSYDPEFVQFVNQSLAGCQSQPDVPSQQNKDRLGTRQDLGW
jgi:hypothetical protein